MVVTVFAYGSRAAAIEAAEHASFYGVFGDHARCYIARKACWDLASDYLRNEKIPWDSLSIIDARSIDTSGENTPYAAAVTFKVDRA